MKPWKQTIASDPEGLCSSALFQSPRSSFTLLRNVAGLEVVGSEELRGTQTTRHRGSLNIGAVQGPVEVWVDESGVVLRERHEAADKGFVSTTDYYDFGVEVDVRRPPDEEVAKKGSSIVDDELCRRQKERLAKKKVHLDCLG